MLTPGAPFSIGDLLAHLILPACLLSIGHAALIMRYMRASLLEVLNQDYVRTARAKGVKEFWVIVKHALRNALLPVVTLIGSTIGIADRRRDLHRERLQLARHGPAAGQCRRDARLSGHHGRDAGHRRLRHPGQPPDRHRLCGRRSAHPGGLRCVPQSLSLGLAKDRLAARLDRFVNNRAALVGLAHPVPACSR